MKESDQPKNRLRTQFSRSEKQLLRRVAVRVGALRESKDLSQAALAKKAHISKNLVSLIETAASAPSLITLWRLAQALETNLSDLLEIEEPKLDTPPPSRTPRRS